MPSRGEELVGWSENWRVHKVKSGKDFRLCKQDSTGTEKTEAFGYGYLRVNPRKQKPLLKLEVHTGKDEADTEET